MVNEPLAVYLGWRIPVTLPVGSRLPIKQRLVNVRLEAYFDELRDCCHRWGLDYNWAITELVWRDYFSVHPDLLPVA